MGEKVWYTERVNRQRLWEITLSWVSTLMPRSRRTRGLQLCVKKKGTCVWGEGVYCGRERGTTDRDVIYRYAAVAACKWVDEVVPNAPYNTTVEILREHNIDFCVHGDDITTMADGTDCYQAVKEAGLYRECKRTQGVSTTELVGRMLLMTRDHHKRRMSAGASSISSFNSEDLGSFSSGSRKGQRTAISHFLPTSKRIVQFSEGKEPKETDKVVYVDGTFDLFHVGHIEFLKRAKALGDFLVVGIHDDQVRFLHTWYILIIPSCNNCRHHCTRR